jgi:predicted acylesterase/phospholipase RssA
MSLPSCEKILKNARSYSEWQTAAQYYDVLKGFDQWRQRDSAPYYPYSLLQEQIDNLRAHRKQAQDNELVAYLQESLHRTLGELTDPQLYNHSLLGSKDLIDAYLNEVELTLNYLCDIDLDGISREQKQQLFKQARQNFGRTALMLSGGGAFGIYHFGVILTLLENNLLPEVITGTSMGAIVAGLVGTHTNEEILEKFSEPEKNNFSPIAWHSPRQMLNKKSIFDPKQLSECIDSNIPNITFLEAFQLTGRVISITVSPSRAGQKSRLLNYKTAPNALVSSACKASYAIPLAFPPAQLQAKCSQGKVTAYMESERWTDGGVSTDMPMGRIGRLFNANHFIVSQTNPHVLPFVGNTQRSGTLPFVLDLAGSSLHAQCHQMIIVAKKRIRNHQSRLWLDRIDNVIGQDYLGHINLHPDFPLSRYLRVMSNPDKDEINNYILSGQRATWPKLAMIRNQTHISRVLKMCTERLKA